MTEKPGPFLPIRAFYGRDHMRQRGWEAFLFIDPRPRDVGQEYGFRLRVDAHWNPFWFRVKTERHETE